MRIDTVMTGRALAAGLASFAISFLVLLPAAAADDPNPFKMADNTWITLSGRVVGVTADSFTLDYGDGTIIVEMDDGDRDADGYKLMEGDRVTVSGAIDDDFYETTTIEASTVYVENAGTTFYASAVDEEDIEGWTVAVTVPLEVSETIVYGTVTDVDEEEFTVDSGLRELRVEVDEMTYNPLDDEGYQMIRVGDRVKVTGDMDTDLFEGRELVADSIVKLNVQ